jgi:hypothetical protein
LIAFAVWLIRRMMQSEGGEVRLSSPEAPPVSA